MRLKKRFSAYTLAFAFISSSGALAQQKAEVLHWWTSAGESASVKVFADQFTKAGGPDRNGRHREYPVEDV